MEDTLKRLLEAEAKAERIVEAAKAEQRALLDQCEAEAQLAEKAFSEQIATIYAESLGKAEQRAQQTLGELERRHAEQRAHLIAQAERHHDEATAAALHVLFTCGQT